MEYAKGSNEIALLLIADGCSGQKKNRFMIMMCMRFHSAPKNIKRIMLVFPIPGHFFIPPDRVFGRIERVINKKECIVDPAKYLTMFFKHEELTQLRDIGVVNWKTSASQGEPYYNTDLGAPKGILKRGRRLQDVSQEGINRDEVPPKEKMLVCSHHMYFTCTSYCTSTASTSPQVTTLTAMTLQQSPTILVSTTTPTISVDTPQAAEFVTQTYYHTDNNTAAVQHTWCQQPQLNDLLLQPLPLPLPL
ncbi:hypothetical protein ILUMI_24577 [Ignelater luminosus]|uniref:Uncharacterized protein n=1 Tax=Ignelater luminosus TaxID=2038154 RepID=A0A8K0CCA5_IGNLU|nr:hypothetical protein ILUMI_24577 [Ignelater luminosus]